MSLKSNSIKQEKKPGSVNGVLKFLGILIVALAVVGLVFSSLFSGGGRNSNSLVFGKYGNKNIEYQYDNAFGQAVEDEMAKYSTSVDQENQFFTFVRFMAWQQAFNSVAVNAAIEYHLDDSGYEVSSRAVDRRIIDFGPFRTDGVFDEVKYRAASQSQKDAIREQFREQMALETWAGDVLDGQYRSSAQLDFLWDMRSEQKTYDYISIPFTDYPDEKVLEYADDNKKLFTKLPVSRITVSDEKTAEEVSGLYMEKKQDIDAFADLAQDYSRDSYKEDGGKMGPTDFYRLSELIGAENSDEIFALNEGEIAGPYDSDYGWILFRVDGKAEISETESRLEDVRTYMLQNEVGIIEDALLADAEKLRVKAIAGGDFRGASEEDGFEVLSTSPFPVNFGADTMIGANPENSGDPQLSGTNSSEDFWAKVIPLTEIGSVSSPVVLGGAVALFSLAGIEEEADLDYWDSLVDYETVRSRQGDLQAAVLNEDSKLFVNEFSDSYDRIFPEQG